MAIAATTGLRMRPDSQSFATYGSASKASNDGKRVYSDIGEADLQSFKDSDQMSST